VGFAGVMYDRFENYQDRKYISRTAQCFYSDKIMPLLESDPLNWHRQCGEGDTRAIPPDGVYVLTSADVRKAHDYTHPSRSLDEFIRSYYGLNGRARMGEIAGENINGKPVRWLAKIGRVSVNKTAMIVLVPLDGDARRRARVESFEVTARYPVSFSAAIRSLSPGDHVEIIGEFSWNSTLDFGYIDAEKLGVQNK
jgi:hypothetical protein